MEKGRTRLFAIGAYQDSMGMGRVMRHLAAGLGERYELHFLALGCPEQQIFEKDGIRYYPVRIPSLRCAHHAATIMLQLKPTITLLSIEPIWLPNYINALNRFRDLTCIVGYLPLEGRFKEEKMASWFRYLDCAVVFTQYSESEIHRVTTLENGVQTVHTAVMPHGVDRHHFFPIAGGFFENQTMEARRQAKQRAFPHRPDLHDSFIVLNANLPYERKRLDLTVQGFALFARDKPANVRLCLHHSIRNEKERAELKALAEREGVAERLVFSPDESNPDGPLSIEQLNYLYNACEVGLNTAMGEGWGLVSFEHAATGAAQVVPGHTTFVENWKDAAEMSTVVDNFQTLYPPFEMDVVSPASVALCLERLYTSDTYRLDLAHKAYSRIQQPQFDWTYITGRWDDLFNELLDRRRQRNAECRKYDEQA
ncbi:MAG: glycosyltransferase family 4 protein [Saprospiraceae bacterium]|nr:glycosyltransferase family 4 protein [Saprospiraceae bacterium]